MESIAINAKSNLLGNGAPVTGSDRRTLDALFQHPLSHNVTWSAVISLFEKLGTVDEKANGEYSFRVCDDHLLMRKPHTKDLTSPEILGLRHFVSKAGRSPGVPSEARTHSDPSAPCLLVVVDHHEARVYQLDVSSHDVSTHAIRPYDPHHFLHHLSHKDQSRERGQRAPEDGTFYERVAEAVARGGKIVLVGHGAGHSNAAHHLAEYLASHHKETYQRVVGETVADLSHLTVPQLLEIGRKALGGAP